ncbi:MAG: family 43 glycosylhydrolase [bacterium]|nr:family 43 glycosylhydrolase [bacterium]
MGYCGTRPRTVAGTPSNGHKWLGRWCALAWVLIAAAASAAPNPVIPRTADCGVLHWNGVYYLMGVGSKGSLYHSTDLVDWKGPVHAFTMKNDWAQGEAGKDHQIHACDLRYINGVFHLYWSVNAGRLRQIGHAIADRPFGPYDEPVTDVPLDGRIDPALFRDRDGSLYLYTTKFNGGNVVWVQPMTDPWTLTGDAKPMLSALADTWERQDHKVNEAQWPLRYRDTYYLLYNANHTGTEYGNYAVGCAVADNPLGFSNDSKYEHPVLASTPDSRVRNCGQVSLVRGPNGFEWWAVYFAIHGERNTRNQAIDRVFFFDRELFIEGPTDAASEGYHPVPHQPTFADRFDGPNGLSIAWHAGGGTWEVKGGEVRQGDDEGFAGALIRDVQGTHYLVEASVRLNAGDKGGAGVIAYMGGEADWLVIGLDREEEAWYWQRMADDSVESDSVPLEDGFDFDVYHRLRVAKNGTLFTVELDGLPVGAIPSSFAGPGTAGLFCEGTPAAFDAVLLTLGWDEWDTGIAAWEPDRSDKDVSSTWTSGPRGLFQTSTHGHALALKGDLLKSYEFSAQVTPLRASNDEGPHRAGMYPVYVDDANWLRADLDMKGKELRISGRRRGRDLEPIVTALPSRPPQHPNMPSWSRNLRVVRLADRVIVFVDGAEAATMPGAWPPSRVGLVSEGASCRYNGILCFAINP